MRKHFSALEDVAAVLSERLWGRALSLPLVPIGGRSQEDYTFLDDRTRNSEWIKYLDPMDRLADMRRAKSVESH